MTINDNMAEPETIKSNVDDSRRPMYRRKMIDTM